MARSPSGQRSIHVALHLAGALFLATPLVAQTPVFDFTRARAVIDSVLQADAIPSIAVAVAQRDRIVFEHAVGMADVEQQIRATPLTAYSLASISKPITATGVMILAQQGFVRLHSPVNHYLGGARVIAREGRSDDVTLERILTHTAGLPLHYQFFYEDGGYERPPMDSTIRRYAVAVYPPGSDYQYSNLGYGLLDYVISRKSGSPYAAYMGRVVFAPLGMTSTSVGPPAARNVAVAQRYDAENRRLPYYTFDHPGASEVYSSARDLARFGLFHLGVRLPRQRPILASETLRDMQRDVAVEAPGRSRGLGWGITSVFGVRRVSHSGGMPGVSTFLALYPEDQTVVVVLLNKSVPRATDAVLTALSAAVMPRFAAGLSARQPSPPPVAVDSSQLAALHGMWRGFVHTYTDSVPLTLVIPTAGAPTVSLAGAAPLALENLALQRNVLSGRTAAQLTPPDLARHAHQVLWWLKYHDGRLSGYAAAQTTTARGYYALSSYVRLIRAVP